MFEILYSFDFTVKFLSFWFLNKNDDLVKEIEIKFQKIIGLIVRKHCEFTVECPLSQTKKTNIHKKPNHSIFLRNLLMVFGVFPLLLGKSRPFKFLLAQCWLYAGTIEVSTSYTSFNLSQEFNAMQGRNHEIF